MLQNMKRISNGTEVGPVSFHTRGPCCQKEEARMRQDLQISIIYSNNPVGWEVECQEEYPVSLGKWMPKMNDPSELMGFFLD